MMAAVLRSEKKNDDSGSSGTCSTTGDGSGSANLSGKDNLQKVFNYLKTKGWTDSMAAGAVGNMSVESEGDPTLAEEGYPGTWGWSVPKDKLRGWGLVQWTWAEHDDIRQYLKKTIGEKFYTSQYSTPKAKDWMTSADTDLLIKAQLDHMDYEMRTQSSVDPQGYYTRTLWKPFIATTTPEQSAYVFLTKYEKPNMAVAKPAVRMANAKKAYDEFKASSPPQANISLTDVPQQEPNTQAKGSGTSNAALTQPSAAKPVINSPESKYAFPMKAPVTMTAGYPTYPSGGKHTGVDYVPVPKLAANPVFAAASGKVVHAGYVTDTGYGNLIVIALPDKTHTMYAHLRSMNVKQGQQVEAGQQIGIMGNSSAKYKSMGEHLHFEIRKGAESEDKYAGTIDDPVAWLKSKGFNTDNGSGDGAPQGPPITDPNINTDCPPSPSTNSGGQSGNLLTAPNPSDPVNDKLTEDTKILLANIRKQFPEVKDIGGWRPSSASGAPDHQQGVALDVMVYNDKALGDRVAKFVMDNHGPLKIDYEIWRQRIWNPAGGQNGGGDGPNQWRMMEDRGDPTSNHMDHVHITVKLN